MEKPITLAEAAERISTSEATLRYWVQNNKAPASFKLGKRRMFMPSVVDAWLQAQQDVAVTLTRAIA